MQCPECRHENPEGARFCNGCGSPLPTSGPSSERRQLTVLFSDLVGSTQMAASLDPEDWSDALQRYQNVCATCADEFGGHVAQFLGDGVLIYFGYPVSHEDSAARALRCGLAIHNALADLNPALKSDYDIALHTRIGVHTGPVVVERLGTSASSDTLALGNTPNVAARLQSLAPEDGIVCSQVTLDLAGPAFDVEDLGPQTLKGVDGPVAAARVHGLGPRAGEPVRHGSTFIGRTDELATLSDLWKRTCDGETTSAMVIGEPGIGKSRLTQAFRSRLPLHEHQWLSVGCSVFESRAPFSPLKDALDGHLGLKGSTADAYAGRFIDLGIEDRRIHTALLEFLSVAPSEAFPVIGSRAENRDLTLQGIVDLLNGVAATRPLVLCVEDLHWVDPSTHELLQLLAGQETPSPVLLLMTSRVSPEPTFPGLTTIPLSGLDPTEVASLIEEILGEDSASLAELAQRSDGIPLFAEELAKVMAESEDPTGEDIPASIRDLLRSQLDRLGDVRQTAQTAAILGREFDRQLLTAVAKLPESTTLGHISELQNERVLIESTPDRMLFRHALIHEEAYSSLLRRDRRALHANVADVMTSQFEETPLHVLAHHRSEAAQPDIAVELWYRAAGHARHAFANQEAKAHLERGLAQLNKLPAAIERDRTELRYQLSLGQVVSLLTSRYNDEAIQAYQRARDIATVTQDSAAMFETLATLQANSVTKEHIDHSREMASQLLDVAALMPNRFTHSTAKVLAGMTEYAAGNIGGAIDSLEPVVGVVTAEADAANVSIPETMADAYLGPAHWMAGQGDRAMAQTGAAVSRAREANNALWLVEALNSAGTVHALMGHTAELMSSAKELQSIAEETGFNQHSLNAKYQHGIGRCLEGGLNEGLSALQTVNEQVHFQGLEGYYSWWQHHIAEQLMRADRLEEAFALIEQTLTTLDEFGGGTNRPMLLGLRARVLSDAGASVDAEADWKLALELAKEGRAFGWWEKVAYDYGAFLGANDRGDALADLQKERDGLGLST